jgi:putative spermidine/putrescine transport system permease protein
VPRPRRSVAAALATALAVALALLVLTPLAVVLLGALLPPQALGLPAEQPGATRGARAAFAYLLTHYGAWLALSGWIAALAAALGSAIAVPAGYALVCHPFRGSRALEELALVPLSLPGIALAVALLAAYPGARGPELVLAGHLLYTLPFLLRAVTAALRARDVAQLEAAARTLGASPLQRLRWVVLPLVRPALAIGALLAFTVSWGEFNVSFLLNAGPLQTFPAALYNTYANETFQRSSAATALFVAGALPALAALQWLGGLGAGGAERSE